MRATNAGRNQAIARYVPDGVQGGLLQLRGEEPHLDTGELHDIIVGELARLGTNRLSVHEREVAFLARLHMDNVIALRPACNGCNLDARSAKRGQRLGQLELTARECATQYLQLR